VGHTSVAIVLLWVVQLPRRQPDLCHLTGVQPVSAVAAP